jgi:carbamoyltransferase
MDMARSVQQVVEEIILRMARHAHDLTGETNLCMAGGVALNCVANGRVLRESPFDGLWIQPAAGDAGGALGAAMLVWHHVLGKERTVVPGRDSMRGAYLGPAFDDEEIGAFLAARGYPSHTLTDEEWAPEIARLVDEGNVVGLLDGRMEFGPRALGARSIIGDARSAAMQSLMNLKIKHRESFRPFAPSCLLESCGEFFDLDAPSPYMLLVAPIVQRRRVAVEAGAQSELRDRIYAVRSDVPAVTHVDYTARVQTVDRATNERYHRLIDAFRERTGCGVVVNTSFNVRGEPIVCTPEDAYRCFMRTEMDYLVLQNHLLAKSAQPAAPVDARRDAVLD